MRYSRATCFFNIIIFRSKSRFGSLVVIRLYPDQEHNGVIQTATNRDITTINQYLIWRTRNGIFRHLFHNILMSTNSLTLFFAIYNYMRSLYYSCDENRVSRRVQAVMWCVLSFVLSFVTRTTETPNTILYNY